MRKYVFIFLSILCMVAIFYFSSQNGETSAAQSEITLKFLKLILPDLKELNQVELLHMLRKAAHFFMYFLMALFVYNSQKQGKKFSEKVLMTVLIVFLYACFDEYHQSFIYGRGSSFLDVLIDLAGGLTALFMLSMI